MTRPARAAEGEFDPTRVPVFPVLTIELTADGGARLGGQTLPVPPGQDPTQVAVAAAADEARLMPGDRGAVRVRGITVDGRVFPLVVRADGTVFELPTTPSPRTRPRWVVPALTAVAALTAGAATVGGVAALRDDPPPPPAQAAPAPLPGAGANLPVPAPPGYSQRAAWAVPVSDRITPVATTSGDLVAAGPDGDLVLLDDLTGHTLWTGQDAPRSGDLHLLHDRGTDLVATSTTRTLTMWQLPSTDLTAAGPAPVDPTGVGPAAGDRTAADPAVAPRAAEPVSVDLPSGATVTFEGSAPLVTLPDQTAAIVTKGQLALVDVPVGATAVAADADSVTAVSVTGTLYDLVPGAADPVALDLPRPPGTDPRPVRSIGAGAAHLVVVWAAGDQQWVVLHDSTTGAALAQGSTTADLTRAGIVRQEGAAQLTVGPVLITHNNNDDSAGVGGAVVPLPADLRVSAVTTGHVYGVLDGEPVDVTTTSGQVTVRLIPDQAAAPGSPAPLPVATTPAHAYVTASKVQQYLLHAVPSTGGTP